MILNDEQLAAIFDMKEDGYLRITKQALESLRDTVAGLKRQLREEQEKVDRAVLAESEWWNARTVATSVHNADLDARVAANRAKVKP